MDSTRFNPSKTVFNPCDRPNTALDFSTNQKTADFQPQQSKFRPQTSDGVRAHHVSKAPPSGVQPARKPKPFKHYKRRCAHGRRIPRVVKSRELRAGCMHVGCDCVKLNGLQDACRRRECVTWHGNPNHACEVPSCGPSMYGNAAHLQAIVDNFHAVRKQQRLEASSEHNNCK